MTEMHVDGNVLAGPLSEVFDVDITTTSARCASCGDVAVLARALVYEKPHSLIVRCSHCEDVLMVVLQKRDATEIDLRGTAWFSAPR